MANKPEKTFTFSEYDFDRLRHVGYCLTSLESVLARLQDNDSVRASSLVKPASIVLSDLIEKIEKDEEGAA